MPTSTRTELTLREAAARCGYATTGHLRRAIAQGRLDARLIGGSYVVTEGALNAFRRTVRARRTPEQMQADATR